VEGVPGLIGSASQANFQHLLDQVASEQGVVPFVGAGMSVESGYPSWSGLLRSLVDGTKSECDVANLLAAGEYEDAAERVLEVRGAEQFHTMIEATFGEDRPHKGAVRLLPTIAPGPVVTTNYDRVLETAFTLVARPLEVIYGARVDRVREAYAKASPALIKLHGDALDRTDRVLTRSDYTKHYGDEGLAGILAFLLTRPLLFVGCSLDKDRVVDLMKQWTADQGGPAYRHFAILPCPETEEKEVERSALLTNLRIMPIWYEQGRHELVGELLRLLAERARAPAVRTDGPMLFTGVPAAPKRRLFGRTEQYEQLKQQVLAHEDVSIFGTVPGIGKTALAIQLANDAEVQSHFHDGVLWVAAGHADAVTLLARLRNWGRAVGLSQLETDSTDDLTELSRKIASEVGLRRMLFVIDDAWTNAAFAFHVGGANAAHVFVTRSAKLAYRASAPREPVILEELALDDSIRVVESIAPKAAEAAPDKVQASAQLTGGWPLALILVGNTLAEAYAGGRTALDRTLAQLLDPQRLFRFEFEVAPTDWDAANAGSPTSLLSWLQEFESALDVAAREALRALTVFPPRVNSFSREAARHVTDDENTIDALQRHGFLDLVDAEEERYSMHRAFCDFARLDSHESSTYRRMGEFFAEFIVLSASATPRWAGLSRERENIEAALALCIHARDADAALVLANGLFEFWYERSRFSEGRRWLDAVLDLPESKAPELRKARALALNNGGNFAYLQGDLSTALERHTEAIGVRRAIEDQSGVAASLNNLGLVDKAKGDYTSARLRFEEALVINRADSTRNARFEAMNLDNLGLVHAAQGDFDRALTLFDESANVFRSIDRPWGEAMTICDKGAIERLRGNMTVALELLRSSLRMRAELDDDDGVAKSLRQLALILAASGDSTIAATATNAALEISMELSDQLGVADSLDVLADVAPDLLADGDVARCRAGAARYRAAQGIRGRSPLVMPHPTPPETAARTVDVSFLDETSDSLDEVARAALDSIGRSDHRQLINLLLEE
jgi:tetratricopeptide (TPR) repeat protein